MTTQTARPVIVRPRKGWQSLDLVELWQYRELLGVLVRRDIKVRYHQTVLGIGWAVIQPLATMVLFTVISRFGRIPTDGVPAPVFHYCGLLPWMLLATALGIAGNSLVGNPQLITKVYFPRLMIPTASVITGLVDFAVAFLLLVGMMLVYGVRPGPQILLAPAFVGLAFLGALGGGLWLSALTAQFRDVRYVTPLLTQLWLFATPILYSSTSITSEWKRAVLAANPMTGVVEGFRGCMMGRPIPWPLVASSAVAILIVFVSSLYYFRRMEDTFADRV